MNIKLYELAKRVGLYLKENNLFIVTAESCTGGLLAATLTSVPGSSSYFERGFVAYSNVAKQEILGVDPKTLGEFGAVSECVAKEMANGALKKSLSQIAVAVTGVAGPDGSTKDKPVGRICFAFAHLKFPTKTAKVNFSGDRSLIREKSVEFVLKWYLQEFQAKKVNLS